jgi:hypothetical protein
LQPAGAQQLASAGAQQLGSAGAQQVASAGAQQVASAGAQQLGSEHPPPQPLFLLNMFLILENSPPFLVTEQPPQPSLPQAAGAQQLGSAGAQQVGSQQAAGAGAQQVGSQHSAGAQQVASAGAQQDGSAEQPAPQPLLLCSNRPKRPAFAVLLIVRTTIAAVRVIPRIVSLLLNLEHEDEEDQKIHSDFSPRNWVTLEVLFGLTRTSDTCKRQ